MDFLLDYLPDALVVHIMLFHHPLHDQQRKYMKDVCGDFSSIKKSLDSAKYDLKTYIRHQNDVYLLFNPNVSFMLYNLIVYKKFHEEIDKHIYKKSEVGIKELSDKYYNRTKRKYNNRSRSRI
jgi:hypothetical protein